jgi:hypothetical protein
MKRWLIPLSCACLFSLAAQAQNVPPPGGGGGPRQACKDDVQKLCSDVKPGGGRIIACLDGHKDQLSQGCSDAMAKARAHHPPPGAGGQSGQPSPGDQPPPSKPQQ